MQTGWVHTGGSWFFMNSSGRMQTGWVHTGGSWFFMNNSGRMQTGWVHTGGNWFFMNNSGRMQTGVVSINRAWHSFAPNGVWRGQLSTVNNVTTLLNADALSYLTLVNRNFRLSSNFSPNDLRTVNVRSSGNQQLRSTAAHALEDMFRAANRAGHTLIAASGYRSYARQTAVHNNHIANHGLAQALRFSARPGHSEHQLGLAMDVSTPGLGGALSSAFSSTPEGRWVRNNAHHFGFIIRYPQNRESDTGFIYEPWHLRFVGVEAATQIFNRGLILEEFLGH